MSVVSSALRLALGRNGKPANGASVYAKPRLVEDVSQCHFYHSFTLPRSGEVTGEWDLRAGVDAYLGGVSFAGKSVLEIGPASGYLTFHMEKQGADVTAVEVSDLIDWDYVPQAGVDMAAIRSERSVKMERVRNSFWLAHRELHSNARMHYGSAYDIPEALGTFDIAVVASLLLHVRDPLTVVENVARVADTVVITDVEEAGLGDAPVARLVPSRENANWDTWWHFTPQLFERFLGVLGFRDVTTTRHEQLFQRTPMPLFTVVGRRG
jgi:O-methyltransferase